MRTSASVRSNLGAGILGGMIAALVMAIVAMAKANATGMGTFLPVKLIAGSVWGVDAILGGTGVIVVGLLIHLAMGAVIGALFAAAIAGRLGLGTSVLAGLAVGVAAWAVSTWVALPAINPTMLARQMVAPGWWLGYHLIFGAMLGLVPLLAGFTGEHEHAAAPRYAQV